MVSWTGERHRILIYCISTLILSNIDIFAVPPPCQKSRRSPCGAERAAAEPGWEEPCLASRSGSSPLRPPEPLPLFCDWLPEGQLTPSEAPHWLLAQRRSVQDWWEVKRLQHRLMLKATLYLFTYSNWMYLYFEFPLFVLNLNHESCFISRSLRHNAALLLYQTGMF